jgi:hypothetical protein
MEIEYSRKPNVLHAGRLSSERREVVAQALDAHATTRAIWAIVQRRGTAADDALIRLVGVGSSARTLWDCIEQAAPHVRHALLQELRRTEASRG